MKFTWGISVCILAALCLMLPGIAVASVPCSIGGVEAPGVAVVVHATKAGDGAVRTPDLKLTVDTPWRGELPLSPDSDWHVSVEATGYWSREQVLRADETASHELDFQLIATGHFSGVVTGAEGAEPPRSARVYFESVANDDDFESGTAAAIPSSAADCEVADSLVKCALPGSRLDIKLQIDNYAPVYFWSVSIKPDNTFNFGKKVLQQGASLTGWVASSVGSVAAKSNIRPQILLEPESMGWQRKSTERSRQMQKSLQTMTDERGFFQLQGLSHGSYTLTASMEGLSPQRIEGLYLKPAEEYALSETILLAPPAIVEFHLEPPLDVYSEPWKVLLSQTLPRTQVTHIVTEELASLEGTWINEGLEPGMYRLEVVDSAGSSWLAEDIEVFADQQPRWLQIDLIEVRGQLTLGEEPLEAGLTFGGQQKPRLILQADEDGHFSGYLPREGRWLVDLAAEDRSVQQTLPAQIVKIRPGKSFAELDIRLPGTRFEGEVVDDDGPVEGAFVLVKRNGQETQHLSSLVTDSEGQFQAEGIEPGPLAVMAYLDDRLSDWSYLELQDEMQRGSNLQLRLKRKSKINGRVTHSGLALMGAEVLARGIGDGFLPWADRDVSGADGRFTLELPPEAQTLDLMVSAPSMAIDIRRIVLEGIEAPATIEVGLTSAGGDLILFQLTPLEPYVLKRHGAEISLSEIRRFARRSGTLGMSAKGGMALARMAEGRYEFCKQPAAGAGDCAFGVLHAGSTLELVAPRIQQQEESP